MKSVIEQWKITLMSFLNHTCTYEIDHNIAFASMTFYCTRNKLLGHIWSDLLSLLKSTGRDRSWTGD